MRADDVLGDELSALPDADELVAMLREMVLGRRFDQEATSLQRVGELGMWAPQLGQEAGQIGVRQALTDADMVFPSYREHSLALAMGVPSERLLAMFRGSALTDWDGDVLRFQPYNLVVGAQAPIAVGYAIGMMLDDEDGATLVFHGDGASAEGDVMEAYNLAAITHAPIVFWCQNNGFAISEPNDKQFAAPLTARACGFGLAAWQVDGNDVLACRAVAEMALDHARSRRGPAFVEAVTYRMGAHTTADDPTRYRTSDDVAGWAARDPIARLEAYLAASGLERPASLDAEADALGERVREECRQIPEPSMDTAFTLVLDQITGDLVDQRAEALGLVGKGQ